MTFLIDTNVISELRKGKRCDPNVAAWYASAADHLLHLSVLTLGEIRQGIERIRPRDRRQAAALDRWFVELLDAFEGRILQVDRAVAELWGRIGAGSPVSPVDGLLAATAGVHGLTLVTRNVRDVAPTGLSYLNPFEP